VKNTNEVWLKVWTRDGDHFLTEPTEVHRIDAAVQQWIDMERDSILDVKLLDGRTLNWLASGVGGWAISSPETRRAEIEQYKWMDDERAAFRVEVGLPPVED
jgi:hypothetical protein